MKEKVTDRNAYKNDWSRENRDRVSLMLPKEGRPTKENVKAAAEASPTAKGSVNGWILEAITEKLGRET